MDHFLKYKFHRGHRRTYYSQEIVDHHFLTTYKEASKTKKQPREVGNFLD